MLDLKIEEEKVRDFPTRLRAIFKEYLATPAQVAKALEIDVTTVRAWMRGTNMPTYENFFALCYYFQISPNGMLGWDDYQRLVRRKCKERLIANGYDENGRKVCKK